LKRGVREANVKIKGLKYVQNKAVTFRVEATHALGNRNKMKKIK